MPDLPTIRKGVEAALREQGALWERVLVWTLDKPSSLAFYLRAGVGGLVTNQPATLGKLLAQ